MPYEVFQALETPLSEKDYSQLQALKDLFGLTGAGVNRLALRHLKIVLDYHKDGYDIMLINRRNLRDRVNITSMLK